MKADKDKPMVIVVMGVTGVGKTTIGKQLANTLGWPFYDADDFHPSTNVEKMRQGMALVDEDRLPWLKALNVLIKESLNRGSSAVLACSALRASYRELLKDGNEGVHFVYLSARSEIVQARLNARVGHFMNPTLLASQFQTLEVPSDAIHVNAERSPDEVVQEIIAALGL